MSYIYAIIQPIILEAYLDSIIHNLNKNVRQSLVIGDIHGRFDLIYNAFELIKMLKESVPTNVIFLGDYIDKGDNSKLVIEKLMKEFDNSPFSESHAVLMGNHEQMCVYAHDFGVFDAWCENGGDKTLQSYNNERISNEHIDFMHKMPIIAEDRNAYYVHAGINPNYAINSEKQYPTCLWVREEFYNSVNTKEYYKPIIYGHTPRAKPKIHRDRLGIISAIGIDTGAEFTDNLTLLQITDDGERTNFTTWHIGKNQTVPSSLFW